MVGWAPGLIRPGFVGTDDFGLSLSDLSESLGRVSILSNFLPLSTFLMSSFVKVSYSSKPLATMCNCSRLSCKIYLTLVE